MQLSKEILSQLGSTAQGLLQLPEKVLQFGTGVLLRGLPDHFIDQANRQGKFNGRIVVVKSTSNGGTDAFKQQDGLYTVLERGIAGGQTVDQHTINASISRVLSASEEWTEILACAANPHMQLIISNTTEVGVTFVESDAYTEKPVSFPGRLLCFLQERYRVFKGSNDCGMVIVPTELLVNNGDLLKSIVVKLARLKGLDDSFLAWLDTANDFCNSLVDRIVPGKLPAAEQKKMEHELGYVDALMIMSEIYSLWAIETDREKTKQVLSFSEVNKGVVIIANIDKFRELKLRLLNGAHTFSCGLACLAGFDTVKEAMSNTVFVEHISSLMLQEIAPLITGNSISLQEAHDFAAQVLDRFRNPYIEHLWLNIAVQYTSKMVMRTVPLVERHYAASDEVPELMALGFAAHILFTRPVENTGDTWYGNYQGTRYPIQDDKAGLLHNHWQQTSADHIAEVVLKDTAIFGRDLTSYKGFSEAVQLYLASLLQQGVVKTLYSASKKQTVV